jgi:hypothetical protein
MFTFFIASALYRDLEISCGCFSTSGGGTINYLTLIRACIVLIVSAAAYAGVVLPRPHAVNRGVGTPARPIRELQRR